MDPNRPRGKVKVKQCCNPWGRHPKVVTRGLREILPENATGVDALAPFIGDYWCNACSVSKVMVITVPATGGQSTESGSRDGDNPVASSSASTSHDAFPEAMPTVAPLPESEDVDVALSENKESDQSTATEVLAPDRELPVLESRLPVESITDGVAGTSQVESESELISQCSFGRELKDICSLDKPPQPTKTLPAAEASALLWSSNLWTKMPAEATVCSTHFDMFVGFALIASGKNYSGCCDPFKMHFRPVTENLRKASILTVLKGLKVDLALSVGDPLCRNCRNAIIDKADQAREEEELALSQSQPSQDTTKSLSPSITGKVDLNLFVEKLGLSPVVPPYYTTHGKVNYAKRKVEEVDTTVRKKICLSLGIEEKVLKSKTEEDAQHFHELMDAIKKKLPEVDRPTKIQLLTLCPPSWTEREASAFFNTSRDSIRRSRALLKEHGIFAKPVPRIGRTLSDTVINAVLAFYCHDDNSRLMPGKKDFISMGGGKHEQKRLLLCTLGELYNKFRTEYPLEKHPDLEIGFSMFCVLRPKYCVMAGSSGTHNVCVCVLHQNLKLKLWALGIKTELKDLIHNFVCPSQSRECMLALCPQCPKLDDLVKSLKTEVLAQSDLVDADDETLNNFFQENVEYSEWTSTDRSELLTKQSSIENLISDVAKSLRKVISHDYISIQQAKYLKNKKENLSSSEAIVLMDFSMNYSCLLQDASQSYHWSKKQCTVHPAVIYFRGEDNKVQHKSLCFISPDIDHDVPMVQEFQEQICQYLKQNHPAIKEVMYVTDGCAAQYKNCKSFVHLTEHEKLYGIKASWFFFASCHGKSASDGIGGTVKRTATLESLRRPMNNQISEEVAKRRILASESKLHPVTIPGTRSFHHFFPLPDSTIGCKRASTDDDLSLIHPAFVESTTDDAWEQSTFAAVLIDAKIYIGLITDLNSEEKEADLSLLYPPLPSVTLNWSEDVDSYIAPYPNLLCPVELKERMDNTYEFPASNILKIRLLAENRRKELRKKK